MKGQVFSIDFVLAIAVLSLSLGIALQMVDLSQKSADSYAELQTNQAEMIAMNITNPTNGFNSATPYCRRYSNGTDGCLIFQCVERTFVAQRLVECGPSGSQGPCLLEVRTCE
ncbi:hypothetical protein KJ765_04795 [Candidatus Micrarchaeota archaeon]|nr:hypothetical protein [Candidatus Micrarchaeota archaeon]